MQADEAPQGRKGTNGVSTNGVNAKVMNVDTNDSNLNNDDTINY